MTPLAKTPLIGLKITVASVNAIRDQLISLSNKLQNVIVQDKQQTPRDVLSMRLDHAAKELQQDIPSGDSLSSDDKEKYNYQAELIQHIANDIINGNSAENSAERIKKLYQDKAVSMMRRCIAEKINDSSKKISLNPAEKITLFYANIDANYFMMRIDLYAKIGIKTIQTSLKETITELGAKLHGGIKESLSLAWSKVAILIDEAIVETEEKPTSKLHLEKRAHQIKEHRYTQEFINVLKMVEFIFSILRRYEKKWYASKEMFEDTHPRVILISQINTKLVELMNHYPDKENLKSINSKMLELLKTLYEDESISKKTAVKEQMMRVIAALSRH